MEFTDIYQIVEYYTNLANDIKYKHTPKPTKFFSENNASYGFRLDEYEEQLTKDKEENKEKKELEREIYAELKQEIFKFVKADPKNTQVIKAWDIAWDRNHSNGYNDVIDLFENLLDLINLR